MIEVGIVIVVVVVVDGSMVVVEFYVAVVRVFHM